MTIGTEMTTLGTGDVRALVEMAKADQIDAIGVLRRMVHITADTVQPSVLIQVVELLLEIRDRATS